MQAGVFETFLTGLGHIGAGSVETFPHEIVKFDWTTNDDNADCAVFLMKHMECFKGFPWPCKELMLVSYLWFIFCI